MRKVKLTRDEKWIEDHLEEFVPASKERFEEIKSILEARKKDAVLNIRVNSTDLKDIKEKASRAGIKYQTFISEILHRVAQGT